MTCKWLPELYPEPNWSEYEEFENELYKEFKRIYLKNKLHFKETILKYRRQPIENGKEGIFYHLITKIEQGSNERTPDKERITRIRWTKGFLDNYICNEDCCNDKPKYWIREENGKIKHKILFRDYVVIIEQREKYFLLITAFYVEQEYYKRRFLKEYDKYIKSKSV